MELNEEQNRVLEAMMAGRNVFLTGAAGTGKSTVLREFLARCNRNCAVLAPTGLAAVNVGGQTINSFFLLPAGLIVKDTLDDIRSRRKKEVLLSVRTIVIDEVSMVRSDVFEAIDERLRSVAASGNREKPFGGKQMVVVGDFYQLSPVVKTSVESAYLKEAFGGEYAFQTELWKRARFESFSLETIYRQKNDSVFMSALNRIRRGDASTPSVDCGSGVMLSAEEVVNGSCLQSGLTFPENGVNLCTTNREANAINTSEMLKLAGRRTTFKASVSGEFPESFFPTEAVLDLLPGARVMLLCNKRLSNGTFQYVNGDIGVVSEIIEGEGVQPMVKVKLDNGNEAVVEGHCWENGKYAVEEDPGTGRKILRKEVIGKFVQLPIRLAWAITIHKSQGMSFDSVNLRLGNGCFSHGQLYTALSRCRSLKGLRLDRPVMDEDLIIDPEVLEFSGSLGQRPQEGSITISIPGELEAEVRAILSRRLPGMRLSA